MHTDVGICNRNATIISTFEDMAIGCAWITRTTCPMTVGGRLTVLQPLQVLSTENNLFQSGVHTISPL